MEEEEGGGIRLSKRLSDKGGEVDYKDKAGTAWSHSYLNQKPWHPLSYPNQRRKWIAEQTHAQRDRRAQEVAREFAQEQEFFRQTALISKKEKEKVNYPFYYYISGVIFFSFINQSDADLTPANIISSTKQLHTNLNYLALIGRGFTL